jgi:hypothetical protein
MAVPALAGGALATALVVAALRPTPRAADMAVAESVVVSDHTPGVTLTQEGGLHVVAVPARGHARVDHGQAATIKLEGAARLRLRADAAALLDGGSATFAVAHRAVAHRAQGAMPYVVTTPHLEARVTGTRFYVNVTTETLVQLLAGSLVVRAGPDERTLAPGDGVRSRGERLESLTAEATAPPPAEPAARRPRHDGVRADPGVTAESSVRGGALRAEPGPPALAIDRAGRVRRPPPGDTSGQGYPRSGPSGGASQKGARGEPVEPPSDNANLNQLFAPPQDR